MWLHQMKTNARVVKVIAKFLFLSQSQIIGLFWLSQPRWSIFPLCILQNVGEKKLWMYLVFTVELWSSWSSQTSLVTEARHVTEAAGGRESQSVRWSGVIRLRQFCPGVSCDVTLPFRGTPRQPANTSNIEVIQTWISFRAVADGDTGWLGLCDKQMLCHHVTRLESVTPWHPVTRAWQQDWTKVMGQTCSINFL